MEKGLSVSEYRQRSSRFSALKNKVKAPKKVAQSPASAPGGASASGGVPVLGVASGVAPGVAPVESAERKETSGEKAFGALKNLSSAFKDSEKFLIEVSNKYGQGSNDELNSIFADFRDYKPLGDKFLTEVTASLAQNFGQMTSANFFLKKDIDAFVSGYEKLVNDQIDRLKRLQGSLYVFADGAIDPRGMEASDEKTQAIADAEAKVPETLTVLSQIQLLKGGLAKFRLSARSVSVHAER